MGRSGLYIRVCLGMDINKLYDKGRDLNLSGSQFPELKNEGIFRLIFLFHLFLFLLLISNTKLNNCTTQCMVHHHILLSKVPLQFYFIFYFIPNLHSFHSMDNQSNTFNICTCICKIYIFWPMVVHIPYICTLKLFVTGIVLLVSFCFLKFFSCNIIFLRTIHIGSCISSTLFPIAL